MTRQERRKHARRAKRVTKSSSSSHTEALQSDEAAFGLYGTSDAFGRNRIQAAAAAAAVAAASDGKDTSMSTGPVSAEEKLRLALELHMNVSVAALKTRDEMRRGLQQRMTDMREKLQTVLKLNTKLPANLFSLRGKLGDEDEPDERDAAIEAIRTRHISDGSTSQTKSNAPAPTFANGLLEYIATTPQDIVPTDSAVSDDRGRSTDMLASIYKSLASL